MELKAHFSNIHKVIIHHLEQAQTETHPADQLVLIGYGAVIEQAFRRNLIKLEKQMCLHE